jgi:hypothetical protein
LITVQVVESILESYSLEEILEMNDLAVADALYLLYCSGDVTLPDPKPVNLDD